MLKVIKDFDINSLTRLANEELRLGLDVDALEMVYDFLNDVYYEGIDEMLLCDILRFDLNVLELEEFINNYGDFDYEELQSLETEERLQEVIDYIEHYGLLYGVYKINDDTFVVFNDL